MIAAGEAWRPLRRAVVWSVALLLVNVAGAWALDRVGVADRILSAGAGALLLLPILIAFLVARLGLFFVAPGLLLRGIALGLLARARRESPR